MHVVHLETGRQLYGGARQSLLLARGLATRGVACTMVCTAGGAPARAAIEAGLVVRELPMHGDVDLGFASRFARLLAELQPDLVHVHSRRGAEWLGGLAARRAGVPAVLSRRVDRPIGRLTAALALRRYARIIAISAAIARQLDEAGIAPERVRLIHSAVEPAPTPAWPRERLLREFGLGPGALAVGCIAQLIPRKGHAPLLDAWPSVVSACPEARLLLFGQGRLEEEFRARLHDTGLASSVVLAGFRPDLPDFLGRLDLVVHPALEEGLGLAVLEAQAAGLPVVACRAGGVPEILADGEGGLLVPAGDAPALANALVALLRDEPRRRAFGEAARARVAREFCVADMVEAHLTCYRDVTETGLRHRSLP